MPVTTINADTVDEIVNTAWESVIEKVSNGHPLSSEKTLCFLFAMTLFERIGPGLVIDFEIQCFEELGGENKFLDLLFYTDPSFKVAAEFKLPRKSKFGGSNQTETRLAIYRDLARLHHLKSHSIKAGACYFFMAANEHAYLNSGSFRTHPKLFVHHGHQVDADNKLDASNLSLSGIAFSFTWKNVAQQTNGRYHCNGPYAWLTPIKI